MKVDPLQEDIGKQNEVQLKTIQCVV